MNDQELLFKIECNKFLPEFVSHNEQNFKLNTLIRIDGFRTIEYIEFDGVDYNYSNIFTSSKYGSLWSSDDAISDFIEKLKTMKYDILAEIVSKDTLFRRELTQLINKYSKENDSNTPDYILADYLIESLKAFNSAKNTIDERNAKK